MNIRKVRIKFYLKQLQSQSSLHTENQSPLTTWSLVTIPCRDSQVTFIIFSLTLSLPTLLFFQVDLFWILLDVRMTKGGGDNWSYKTYWIKTTNMFMRSRWLWDPANKHYQSRDKKKTQENEIVESAIFCTC